MINIIEFAGYKQLHEDPRRNDKLNIIAFLQDCNRLFSRFYRDNNNQSAFRVNQLDFTLNYSEFIPDLEKGIFETQVEFEKNISGIVQSLELDDNPWRRFSHSKLKRAGLTGDSLKLKLNTNKAGWNAIYNDKKKKIDEMLKKSEMEDNLTMLDYVKSILSSLFSVWRIGENGKELLDIFTLILKRLMKG